MLSFVQYPSGSCPYSDQGIFVGKPMVLEAEGWQGDGWKKGQPGPSMGDRAMAAQLGSS